MSTIWQEFADIENAKETLADTLISKFGVPEQDNASGDVKGLYKRNNDGSKGSLKRLVDWAIAVTATTLRLDNVLEFTNSGSGATGPISYDGTAKVTVSYNTIGALPAIPATGIQLGGVMIGDNINVDADGKISVTFPTIPIFDGTAPGLVDKVGTEIDKGKVFLNGNGAWVTVSSTDTLVKLNYISNNSSYPLLFSALDDITSTLDRGVQESGVNNNIYVNPSSGSLNVISLIGTDVHTNSAYIGNADLFNITVNASGLVTKSGTEDLLKIFHDSDWNLTWLGNPVLTSANYTNYTYSNSESRGQNTVLAAPANKDGAATFRTLVSSDIPNLSSDKITRLDNYVKITTTPVNESDISLKTTDSLNGALSKLEYKADLAYTFLNAEINNSNSIDNLKEILHVLQGITETDTIKNLLGKYLPLTGGTLYNTSNDYPLCIKGITGSGIEFKFGETDQGYLLFKDSNFYKTIGATDYEILDLNNFLKYMLPYERVLALLHAEIDNISLDSVKELDLDHLNTDSLGVNRLFSESITCDTITCDTINCAKLDKVLAFLHAEIDNINLDSVKELDLDHLNTDSLGVNRLFSENIWATNVEAAKYIAISGAENNNISTILYTPTTAINAITKMNFSDFLNRIRDTEVITIYKNLTLTTEWTDTGINGNNAGLSTGTYIVQVQVYNNVSAVRLYNMVYSGIMSWSTTQTNSEVDDDEIVLHRTGHASNNMGIYLKTHTVAGSTNPPYIRLQICCSSNTWTETQFTFKFRRII